MSTIASKLSTIQTEFETDVNISFKFELTCYIFFGLHFFIYKDTTCMCTYDIYNV